jgi:hypothetical protein
MFTTAGPTASASWLKLAGTIGGSTEVDAQAGGVPTPGDPPTAIAPASAIPASRAATAHRLTTLLRPKPIFRSSLGTLSLPSVSPIMMRIPAAGFKAPMEIEAPKLPPP